MPIWGTSHKLHLGTICTNIIWSSIGNYTASQKKKHFWNSLRTNQCYLRVSLDQLDHCRSYLVLDNLDRIVEPSLIVGAKSSTIIMVFRLNIHRNRTQFLEIGRFCEQSCSKLFSLLFFPSNIYWTKCKPKRQRCIPKAGLQVGRKILFLPWNFWPQPNIFWTLTVSVFQKFMFQTSCKCHIR